MEARGTFTIGSADHCDESGCAADRKMGKSLEPGLLKVKSY